MENVSQRKEEGTGRASEIATPKPQTVPEST